MNEPPGARLRVGLSALTMAEYFRDEGQDVLLFIDNIFRFVQAGSEVSALLGRMPSAVGYQPTLAPRWASSRSGSRRPRRARSRRSRRSSSRPTTTPTPRRRTSSRTSTRRSCSSARSSSRASTRRWTRWPRSRASSSPNRRRRALLDGDAGAGGAPALQGPPGHHRDPRHGRADRRGQADRRPRAQDPAVPVAAELRRRAVHGIAGEYVSLEETIKGFNEILEGKHDDLPEQAFYMVGGIEQAVAKGRG